MYTLSGDQHQRLGAWRKEVMAADHVLSPERLLQIEEEMQQWDYTKELAPDAKFFERFDLYDAEAHKTGAQTWRGLAHWLWLRHGCVHGMLFTPSNMVILQRRALSVEDSPGFIEMTFAGHMGTSRLRAATRLDGRQALESEAMGEAGVDLLPGSEHVEDAVDLEPICHYNYVEPPRPKEEFYNVEIRYVFAIRITSAAMGALRPLDDEAGSFLLTSLDEAWTLLREPNVASALRVSGPLALYHAMKTWGLEISK
jgi:isopentenyldiphosphate isomerase